METNRNDVSNRSDNRPFDEVIRARISRRSVLAGSAAAAAVTFIGAAPAAARGRTGATTRAATLDFEAVPLSFGNEVVVPDGYTATPFLPWGTPIVPGTAPGDFPADAADQERRIGLGHDGMWFFPTRRDHTEGILCLNMEFGDNDQVANGTGLTPGTAEFVAMSQAVHGVAVVEIAKTAAGWEVVMGRHNRRITPSTPVTVSGPVAGSPLLDNTAGNPVAGTVNNCANGKTPWGTYLTCEENFNGYFGANGAFTPTEEQARYGLSDAGFGYGWHEHDARWDLTDPAYANEHNRFGWVVEIDPMDASAAPVKRSALGRNKHENCEIVEGRGKRIVAYMGDDERFEYVYKFVSDGNWKSMRARGMSPLDHGTLYTARFDDDGTGQWLPLTLENPALADRFPGMDDLLVNTRIAADIVGATPMDRPEWAAVDPTSGDVFLTMTNNSRRTEPNAANPRSPNPWGHILRIEDSDDHVGTSFEWDIFLLAGPAGQDGSTTDADSEFGSPDGIAFDVDGNLFIETDGGQPGGANDQMLVADPGSGDVKRFLTGVNDCEITGWTRLDDGSFMINVQHPGNGDPAVTSWPAPDGSGVTPRDACVIVTKD